MMKKKVAIITSGYFPVPAAMGGAVEALDENLIKQNEIDNRIHFCVFSCYNQKAEIDAKKYKNSSFIFVKIPWIIQMGDKAIYYIFKNIIKKEKSMSYRYILQRIYFIAKVAKNLHKNNYDRVIIENHSTLFMTLKKYKNYIKYKDKYYYHLHNVVTNAYGCDDIIGSCKCVIGVSDYINRTLKQFLGQKDHNQYTTLKNRIDRDKFLIHLSEKKKCEYKNKYGINENDVLFLFCGRFNEEKGIRQLLQAFEYTDENCKLLVVGGYYYGSGMISPFEKEMYSFVKENLESKVRFTGQIDYEQIPQIYALADVVVIPSIWDDPAPLTVIESLTSGKALITTDSGGIPEYADEESSIILKRDNNFIKKLAKTINMLAQDSNKRISMTQKVLGKTKDWNIETYYKDFCDILEI